MSLRCGRDPLQLSSFWNIRVSILNVKTKYKQIGPPERHLETPVKWAVSLSFTEVASLSSRLVPFFAVWVSSMATTTLRTGRMLVSST